MGLKLKGKNTQRNILLDIQNILHHRCDINKCIVENCVLWTKASTCVVVLHGIVWFCIVLSSQVPQPTLSVMIVFVFVCVNSWPTPNVLGTSGGDWGRPPVTRWLTAQGGDTGQPHGWQLWQLSQLATGGVSSWQRKLDPPSHPGRLCQPEMS